MRPWSFGRSVAAVVLSLCAAATFLGCGGGGTQDPSCAQSLCGCYEPRTLTFSTRVLDGSGNPVEGATVTCHGETTPSATAGADGRVSFVRDVQWSPGCHYVPCGNLIFAGPGGTPSVELSEFQSNGKDVTLAQ